MLIAAGSNTASVAEAEALPSAELLLYLSEFEDADGDFVDPMALQEGTSSPVRTQHSREDREPADAAPAAAPTKDDDRDDPQRLH